jgi:hypothetical protein
MSMWVSFETLSTQRRSLLILNHSIRALFLRTAAFRLHYPRGCCILAGRPRQHVYVYAPLGCCFLV